MNNFIFFLTSVKGPQDEYFRKMEDYVNLRKYIDENEDIENIEKIKKSNKIELSSNIVRYTFEHKNKYLSDFVIKLPFFSDLNIYDDIFHNITYEIGGQNYTEKTNMYHLAFFNWLYDKEIKIKNGYIYIPLTNNINIYNTSTFMNHNFRFIFNFTDKYFQKFNKKENNECIEFIYHEYNFDHDFVKEKINRKNLKSFSEKIIQHQECVQTITGEKDSQQICLCPFNHPVFCLYVYGFNKEDIYDVKLVLNNQYIYDMILKEKTQNIFVLEFADPLLYNRIFDEPLTNIDIYNKKTINFSRIDNVKIKFKKSNNKDFIFHITALNYNISRTMSGMMGLAFAN